jgi:hypothetical protein
MMSISFLAFVLVLLSLNVDQIDSLKLTIALVLQMIPGLYLWRIINNRRQIPFSEMIGMGLAIGTLLAIISSAFLRDLPLGEYGWIAPFLLTLIVGLFRKGLSNGTQSSVKANSIKLEVRGFLLVVSILAYMQVYVWSQWHSINPKGWWKYHVDVPYFESLSNSIALLGTSDSLMKSDLETRYHWFAFGWIGSLNQSLDVDPFVVQTRLLPLVALIMAAAIAFAWTKDFTDNAWLASIASLLIVVGPGFAIGSFVMLRSPSSAMAAGWTLAFSLLFLRCLRASKTNVPTLFTLYLLSIGVVAGKGVNVLIIGIGVFVLFLNHLLTVKAIRMRELQLYLGVITSLILTYFQIIHTTDGRTLKFNFYLGWPALMLTVLPLALGIFLRNCAQIKELLTLKLYAFSIFLAGAILSFVTSESAGSQLYFVVSAATICIVPSLVLAEGIFRNSSVTRSPLIGMAIDNFKWNKMGLFLILIPGVTASATWIVFENYPSKMGDMGRAAAPTLVWGLAIMGTLALITKNNYCKQDIKLIFFPLILAIVVFSSSVGIVASLFKGPIYAASESYVGYGKSHRNIPGAFSTNYFKAGEWVQKNIEIGEKFFTNRQCLDPKSRNGNCLDVWFLASALSERQYLIEGGAYNIASDEYKNIMEADQKISLRFSLTPNLDDLDYLWGKGVRWGWIDKLVIERSDWLNFADIVFNNDDIAIIKLINPNKFQNASN